MKLLLDSFWRAVAYLLLPRVIGLSLLPLLLAGGAALGLGWLFWADALSAVRGALEHWALVDAMLKWLENTLGAQFRVMLAPVIVWLDTGHGQHVAVVLRGFLQDNLVWQRQY